LADGFHVLFIVLSTEYRIKKKSLEDVIECGFTTILTSGGEHPAMEGKSKLKLIQEQADGRITILVGGGTFYEYW
jgi:copper homeostasis protein